MRSKEHCFRYCVISFSLLQLSFSTRRSRMNNLSYLLRNFGKLLPINTHYYTKNWNRELNNSSLMRRNILLFMILFSFLAHFLTGCDAPTPSDSKDTCNMALPDALAPPSSPDFISQWLRAWGFSCCQWRTARFRDSESEFRTGRQKARAAVMKINPPEMFSKLCNGFKKWKYTTCWEYSRPWFSSTSWGMKRAAAKILRSRYEIYSFSSRHDLPQTATDAHLQLLNNSSVQLWMLVFGYVDQWFSVYRLDLKQLECIKQWKEWTGLQDWQFCRNPQDHDILCWPNWT